MLSISFHARISHLYVIFEELSVQIFTLLKMSFKAIRVKVIKTEGYSKM